MVREILRFTQVLGHSEVCYLCDNEPSIRQVQFRAVRARLAQGLATHDKTPAAYSHGNSLCENTVGRVRSLAGSLMFHLQEKISVELSTNNSIWSWAMRHSSWLLNRFAVTHGVTPYELVYSKPYTGKLAEFGEPIFAYVNTAHKGNAKWQRVIMLGKTESQDTYVVFTGSGVMLTKSVRGIQCEWKAYLGFYIHFNAPTWQFKPGFGGRIIPTKRTVEPSPESAQLPVGPVLPSILHVMQMVKQSNAKLRRSKRKKQKQVLWAKKTFCFTGMSQLCNNLQLPQVQMQQRQWLLLRFQLVFLMFQLSCKMMKST
eukprot:s357_g26.t1